MKITYVDKEQLNINENVADKYKCNASDLNEIKNVVNANEEDVGDIADLQTEDMTSIVNAINELNNKTNIVYRETLSEDKNQITITGLDLLNNNYEVIIEGTGSGNADIDFTCNNLQTTSYWQAGYYFVGTPTGDVSNISISQGVRTNKKAWYFATTVRSNPFINIFKLRKIPQNVNGVITLIPYVKWENNCLWNGVFQQSNCFGINPTDLQAHNVTELYFRAENNVNFLKGTKVTVWKTD